MPPARLSPTVDPDAEEQAQASVLKTLLATAQHFFGGFSHLFARVRDPRRPEWITYPAGGGVIYGRLDVCLSLGRAAANQLDVPGQCALGPQI